MRKLKKTMAILSLLSPLGVNALGVGDIKLHSALNQNLRAEIPLINPKVKSVSDIRVSLAPPGAFSRAGIERPFYLSSLRFRPIIKTDGSVVVKVTSIDVIREPFVDFLLDVSWPQGHILREFTILLDPPVTFQKKSVPVASVPVTKTRRLAGTPVPKENIAMGSSAVITNPISYSSAPEPKPIPSRTQKRFKARTPKATSRVFGFGENYGPIVRNETLWNVVNSVERQKGVSKEQLLMGIYRENPQAFYKNNINALKAGQTLTIPTRDVIVQLSTGQALAEYKRQNDVWSGRISDAPPKKSPTKKSGRNQQPKKSNETPNQLKLVSPSGEELRQAGASAKEMASENANANAKADLALEMATSVGQENQQLQTRLAALEEQLLTMQRMLVLKDEQLAAMQAQSSQQLKPTELQKEPDSSASINLPKQTVQPKAAPKVQPIKKTVKPTLKKPKPTKSVSEAKPDDLLSEFLSEPYYLAAAGAGIVLFGLFAWVVIRKRRGESEDDIESILTLPEVGQDFSREKPKASDANGGTIEESSGPVESSFLSEFTPSEFDAIDSETDEVDAISEADVYLAYGRYQQAEDLIQQAIKDEPGNDECKLKLLEIYFAKESKEAFVAYASELSKDRGDDLAFWQKVVEMGQDLCPGDPLFGGVEEISSLDEVELSGGAEIETGSPNSLSNFMSEPDSNNPDLEETKQNAPLEFNAPPAGANKIDDIPVGAVQDSDWGDERQIELDNTGLNDGQNSEEPDGRAIDDGVVLEFISPASNAEDSPMGLNRENEYDGNETSDASELDFYLDDTNDDTVSGEEEKSMDDDFDSLTDMDEVETKLDLAKAYVDMEDGGAAQDILREIFELGNEEQKTEAQSLMEKLQMNG